MPGIELHADFDRDGRLTGSAGERKARRSRPGAIVVPNLDRDRDPISRSATADALRLADYELATPEKKDNELVPVEVRGPANALGHGERLIIRCTGVMHTRVDLHDQNGTIVPHQLGKPEFYELPALPANGILRLTLQVRTIAGAAFGRASSLDLTYRHEAREESRFQLILLRRDAAGIDHEEDRGHFSVAPFILADRLARAYRLYMVYNGYNHPSYKDVYKASKAIGIQFLPIPPKLAGGDTWIQDQYQHSLMQGPKGWRELIFHLPRLRNENANATGSTNLEAFVNGHFRSRDIGLFRDLWERTITLRTATGGVAYPGFRDLDTWVKKAEQIPRVIKHLDRLGDNADSSWKPANPGDWVEARHALKARLALLNSTIDTARTSASTERAAQLEAMKKASKALVDRARKEFPTERKEGKSVITSTIDGVAIPLEEVEVRKLFNRARQMHDSMNYGGNIESTPPLSKAAFGKIIIGNAINPDTGGEFMDPDVLRVFAKQKKQPIVEINTSWLKVGHIDEMLSVVPHGQRKDGFSILHASASAAMEILVQADLRFRHGLPISHPMRTGTISKPLGNMPRLMKDGTSPVTRLFRGKAWLHVQQPTPVGRVGLHIEPPSVYLQLCKAFGTSAKGSGYTIHDIGYVPGEGPIRQYPADITINEILWSELDGNGKSSNRAFDKGFLAPSRTKISEALPGIDILPVPVLFDRTENVTLFENFYWRNPTTAFTPDMVNLQVLNGHILVPKPYGPRMRPPDAIAVVRKAMEVLEIPNSISARVSKRLIKTNRIPRATYWVEKYAEATLYSSGGSVVRSYGSMLNMKDVIEAFKDSFPGASKAELERRIIRPNRRYFDANGNLRHAHSQFRISDGMVDLFELFTAAIAEELNVRLHFVDSWYYHLRDGQIHCGTNVLRRPRGHQTGWPNVWDAPDHNFRAQVFNFDDGEAIKASAHTNE